MMFVYFQLTEIQSQMESIYSKAKVCLSSNKCLKLDPGKCCGHYNYSKILTMFTCEKTIFDLHSEALKTIVSF